MELNTALNLERVVFTGYVAGVATSILTAGIGSSPGEACFFGAAVMRRPPEGNNVRVPTSFELDGTHAISVARYET